MKGICSIDSMHNTKISLDINHGFERPRVNLLGPSFT